MKLAIAFLLSVAVLKGCGSNPPAPPPGVVDVVLKWNVSTVPTGAPPVLGYNVYRSKPLQVAWTKVGAGVVATNFTDGTVAAGQSYDYEVTAFNADGESDPSPMVSVVVP